MRDSPKLMREPRDQSCKVLLDLIADCDNEQIKSMMLDDLLFKSSQVSNQKVEVDAQRYFTLEALPSFVPDIVRKKIEPRKILAVPEKKRVDVAFVTVIQPELTALKIALGIDLDQQEDRNVDGIRFWEKQYALENGNAPLQCVVTMVGESGNLESSTLCDRLFGIYNVELCILMGIAAGLEDKVQLGDVVSADLVIGYESSRREIVGEKRRPVHFSLKRPVARDLQHFDPTRSGWYNHLRKCLEVVERDPHLEIADEVNVNEFTPSYKKGVILSGEKLIADGSLPQMREDYHERVRALEMEAAGFARRCDENDTAWLVFRGISDFGAPDKNDAWQIVSSVAAATATLAFLRKSYRPHSDEF